MCTCVCVPRARVAFATAENISARTRNLFASQLGAGGRAETRAISDECMVMRLHPSVATCWPKQYFPDTAFVSARCSLLILSDESCSFACRLGRDSLITIVWRDEVKYAARLAAFMHVYICMEHTSYTLCGECAWVHYSQSKRETWLRMNIWIKLLWCLSTTKCTRGEICRCFFMILYCARCQRVVLKCLLSREIPSYLCQLLLPWSVTPYDFAQGN